MQKGFTQPPSPRHMNTHADLQTEKHNAFSIQKRKHTSQSADHKQTRPIKRSDAVDQSLHTRSHFSTSIHAHVTYPRHSKCLILMLMTFLELAIATFRIIQKPSRPPNRL